MKGALLSSTSPLMYATEIPVVALLSIVIKHNGSSEGPVKLYPLMIALIGAFIFIFIYLFRFISVSGEEIRSIGPFSTRDRALIDEGKTLTFTLRPHGKIRVELFGYDDTPAFSWVKTDEQEKKMINLYRDRAVGGGRAVKRVLSYFDIPQSDIDTALSDDFSKEYENYKLASYLKDGQRVISLTFFETL